MDHIQVSGKIVFVVDDDAEIRNLIQAILARSGLDSRTFHDGEDMIRAIAETHPDLILLDVDMPGGMDGFEVCLYLKSDRVLRDIPVIFLSGVSDVTYKVRGFESGAVDYIPKPVLARELIARVKTHLISSQLRRELEASEARYRSMMESMTDPVYIVSPDCIIDYMNPAMVRYNGGSAVGETCHKKLHGLDKRCEWCALDQVGQDRSVETKFTSPGDGRRFVVTNTPIRHQGGRIFCMTIMRDVTDYLTALEEKKEAQHQLSQAQKLESVGQLAAGIAHEINTPIQYAMDNISFLDTAFSDIMTMAKAIPPFLEVARTGNVSEADMDRLESAIDAADLAYHEEEIPLSIAQTAEGMNRVAKIVKSMKAFSHPGGERTLTDINAALDNTVTISRNVWKYTATVACEFDRELPGVLCNPGEINQVFLNLIVNASQAVDEKVGKAGESKGSILIQTLGKADSVQILIRDTGIGIAKDNLDRIFDPFFTTKKVGQGTGQGLAISYDVIVNKHKGRLQCESEPGKGTTFTITLPKDDSKPA